jgi:hypothetical protein
VACPSIRQCYAVDVAGNGFFGTVGPVLSLSAPASGTVGSAIPSSALIATISGGASPSGTVTFEVFGPQESPPANCSTGGTSLGSAAVSGDGAVSAPAAFTPTAAGNYWWYVEYSGDGANVPAASACRAAMAKTVVPTPPASVVPTPPASVVPRATASVGRAKVSGRSVRLPIACHGPAAAKCSVGIRLTVTETLRGRKLIAVRARAKHRTLTKKIVSVGRASITLRGGKRRTIVVQLNAVGRRLLASRRVLKVMLTATQHGKRLSRSVLTFKAKHRRRTRTLG